ncbi:F-box protein SKIP31-like [Dioscorea cayenensis subsp. rotundata]|uniref:F-box protein SKIP31-like n=1 Tax=Dioscorea cayennensis subsp. rotundata TaxID=55577 RepID=A0AB40CFW2_DIOCR|nr:F-box protein SKIP31-like [Dioscorea cayenensis subsp. rotundata]
MIGNFHADTIDEDEVLAHFLELEILSNAPLSQDDGEKKAAESIESKRPLKKPWDEEIEGYSSRWPPSPIENGIFGEILPELYHHILKFLSSENLIACSRVCRFMNFVTSDECL